MIKGLIWVDFNKLRIWKSPGDPPKKNNHENNREKKIKEHITIRKNKRTGNQ